MLAEISDYRRSSGQYLWLCIFVLNLIVVLTIIGSLALVYDNREMNAGAIPEEEPEPIYIPPAVEIVWTQKGGEKCSGKLYTLFDYVEANGSQKDCEKACLIMSEAIEGE